MEGDAGTRQLNPTDADEALDESLAAEPPRRRHPAPESPQADGQVVADDRRPSRLGRGWVATICAGLLLLAGAGAVAGYLALKANQQNQDTVRRGSRGPAGRQGLRGRNARARCHGDERRAVEDHRMFDG